MDSTKIKETDIAKKVIEWLISQHWEIYQEVRFFRGSSIADIVAVRQDLVWIIECKTSFSLNVLYQAYSWHSHYRSIAVPHARKNTKIRKFGYELAKYLKIGLIEVGKFGIEEKINAPLMREYHKFAKYMLSKLVDEQKHYAEAGTKGGGYYTPYKATMNVVKKYIQDNPGCTRQELMDYIGNGNKHHYRSLAGAKLAIPRALDNWERDWCDSKYDADSKQVRYYLKKDAVNE